MNTKLIMLAGAGLIAVGGYALAQNVDGLDLGAISAKAERDAADQAAFARDVMRRGEEVRSEAATSVGDAETAAAARVRGLKLGSDGQIDFDGILHDASVMQQDQGKAPRLIVFASLSMPEASLKALIQDTAKAGGAVVFRGFPGNSMKAFQQGIMKVVSNRDDYSNIGIDPRLFRAFNVQAVPTFVAVSSDFDACDGFDCTAEVPPFDRMSGNVTLGHVLETFAEGRGPGAAVAEVARKQLEGRGS